MPAKRKPIEIWRFQRDRIYPDVVTGVTKDKKRWVFITARSDPEMHAQWVKRFGERQTIYVQAIVGITRHKPSIRIVREVDDW